MGLLASFSIRFIGMMLLDESKEWIYELLVKAPFFLFSKVVRGVKKKISPCT